MRTESPKPTLNEFHSKARPDEKWVVRWLNDEPHKPKKYKRFKTKQAAENFRADKEVEILNRGRKAAALRGSAVEEAVWAKQELEEFGVSIRDVVADYVERQRAIEKSAKIEDAVDIFLDVKKKAGRSVRYIGDLRAKLKRFALEFGEKPMSDLGVDHVSQWLEGLKVGAITKNGYRRVLVVFFAWGRKQGYCKDNPPQKTEVASEKKDRVPIFTPSELRVILRVAPAELIPFLAFGAFSGLRSEEIKRLDWSNVNLLRNRIEVNAEISKTAEHRYVPINATLKSWLKDHAKNKGSVVPLNLYRRLWWFRRDLAKGDEDNGIPKVKWKQNALRHSFASYELARLEDAARVALWLGHTSPTMTFEHYRERVEKETALEWFGVLEGDQEVEEVKEGAA